MNQQRKPDKGQRRRVILTAGILLAVAVLIYLAFIAQGVLGSASMSAIVALLPQIAPGKARGEKFSEPK